MNAPEQEVEPRLTRVIRIEIAPWTIFSVVLVIAGLWIFMRLLPVFLVLVGALMIVGTHGPAVDWLEQRGVRRVAGIAIIFTVLFVVTVLLFVLTIPERGEPGEERDRHGAGAARTAGGVVRPISAHGGPRGHDAQHAL